MGCCLAKDDNDCPREGHITGVWSEDNEMGESELFYEALEKSRSRTSSNEGLNLLNMSSLSLLGRRQTAQQLVAEVLHFNMRVQAYQETVFKTSKTSNPKLVRELKQLTSTTHLLARKLKEKGVEVARDPYAGLQNGSMCRVEMWRQGENPPPVKKGESPVGTHTKKSLKQAIQSVDKISEDLNTHMVSLKHHKVKISQHKDAVSCS